MTEKFKVTGMSCAACSAHVEKAVSSVPGVKEVSVSLFMNSMNVDYQSPATPEKIMAAVSDAGYTAEPEHSVSAGTVPADDDIELMSLIRRLTASALILLPVLYVSMGYSLLNFPLPSVFENRMISGLFQLVCTGLIMAVNRNFFVSGFQSLIHGGPGMDTLVSLGAGASFLYSTAVLLFSGTDSGESHLYFESAAMILTLITAGRALETRSRGKAASAVRSLLSLVPDTACVVRNGEEIVIPAEQVAVGDTFNVRPGDRIPVDGTVCAGESSVDESSVTGESFPADKFPGQSVTGGTVNLNGFLSCTAVRVGKDTALNRIIQMVEKASTEKAPVSKTADRISGIFVPVVIILSLITFAVWLLAGMDTGFALARAVSVLVISCPCALGLATPAAIMAGSGTGARHGILFKTAEALENAGKTDILLLDKTGTLTEGKPFVTDVLPEPGISHELLLSIAGSLECLSRHPLASAVMRKVQEENTAYSMPENFRSMPGLGIESTVDGRACLAGSMDFMNRKGVLTEEMQERGKKLSMEGKTPVYFMADGTVLGIISAADRNRPDAFHAVNRLRNMGIRTVMVTGDNKYTAEASAAGAGIEQVIYGVLPEEKALAVKNLSVYGKTAMAGDGINDGPALVTADTGIAVGSGTDAAMDSSDLVLAGTELNRIPAAVSLSRQVLRNIRQNLFWAFFYNCAGIPLAAGAGIPAFGLELNPVICAGAMSLSSFCVLANALRLNMFNPLTDSKDHRKKPVSIPDTAGIMKSVRRTPAYRRTVYIKDMMCEHCEARIKKAFEAMDQVLSAEADWKAGTAVLKLTEPVPDRVLMGAAAEAGYFPVKCTD